MGLNHTSSPSSQRSTVPAARATAWLVAGTGLDAVTATELVDAAAAADVLATDAAVVAAAAVVVLAVAVAIAAVVCPVDAPVALTVAPPAPQAARPTTPTATAQLPKNFRRVAFRRSIGPQRSFRVPDP